MQRLSTTPPPSGFFVALVSHGCRVVLYAAGILYMCMMSHSLSGATPPDVPETLCVLWSEPLIVIPFLMQIVAVVWAILSRVPGLVRGNL